MFIKFRNVRVKTENIVAYCCDINNTVHINFAGIAVSSMKCDFESSEVAQEFMRVLDTVLLEDRK